MIELTTMCAVIDSDKVLMINRKKNWKGWAFPGGHLENGESMLECVIREIKEETGLIINDISYKGFTHFYNPTKGNSHIINNYLCKSFDGVLITECSEGDIAWININELESLNLAEGMIYRLPLFFEKGLNELYIEWNENEGYTKINYQKM